MKLLWPTFTCCVALGLAVQARADSSGGQPVPTRFAAAGKALYESICQGCHMPDARGATGAGSYPALAGDAALASADFAVITLLQGRRNMPSFGDAAGADLFAMPPRLSDEQIAAVINYVRTNFGNRFKGTVTPAQVAAMRKALSGR